jgi:hypothetical protein
MPARRAWLAAAVVGAAWLPGAGAEQASTTAGERLESFYFDVLGYTEIWVDLTPPPATGDGQSAVTLNVTVRHHGKPVKEVTPELFDRVIVRARSNPFANPLFVRRPELVLFADGVPAWDPESPVNFYYLGPPCETCVADTVDLSVSPEAIRLLADAGEVTGNAMGLTFELTAAQVALIRELVARALPSDP